MIFVNPNSFSISQALRAALTAATEGIKGEDPANRADYLKKMRSSTWGDPALVAALKEVVGNKCWYSEVALEGADPNVDHFRPKGRVVEVDDQFSKTGRVSDGYWWLAFEPLNFRLSSQHANQRRVDEDTNGGKADFFPVKGDRAEEGKPYMQIFEYVLPLDPCSASDTSLMWFDPDGNPVYLPRNKKANLADEERVKTTIWLYHLDKEDTARPRSKAVEEIRTKLKEADNYYVLWHDDVPCLKSKASFDRKVAEIADLITDKSSFARAKRCAVRLAMADYEWIESCSALLII